jgi:acyl dehydratase
MKKAMCPRWYYEDFSVGQKGSTYSRLITEADVVNYAGISGDFHPAHVGGEVDRDFFTERIAHGLLGTSIAIGLLSRDLPMITGTCSGAVAELEITWQFKAPLFIGESIHVEWRVIEKRKTRKPDQGIICHCLSVVNQEGRILQKGRLVQLFKKRGKSRSIARLNAFGAVVDRKR